MKSSLGFFPVYLAPTPKRRCRCGVIVSLVSYLAFAPSIFVTFVDVKVDTSGCAWLVRLKMLLSDRREASVAAELHSTSIEINACKQYIIFVLPLYVMLQIIER